MTTIAYHHKTRTIAVDSRRTGDGFITNDNDIKFQHHTNGTLWFFTGRVSHADLLLSAYDGKLSDGIEQLEANAFYVQNGMVYRCGFDDGEFWSEYINFDCAIGNGYKFAIAAMDFNVSSAREAVQYAMTRDMYSGGKIHVYDVEQSIFLEDVLKN